MARNAERVQASVIPLLSWMGLAWNSVVFIFRLSDTPIRHANSAFPTPYSAARNLSLADVHSKADPLPSVSYAFFSTVPTKST